jgi:glutamyl-tRNA reductase
MEIVLVGLNFRTAPVEVRERVSFSTEQAQRASEELRAQGILEETLVLSTCNRSEVYGVHQSANRESANALSSFLSSFHCVQPDKLNPSLYHHYDHDAVRHLFRVSAGLESMLLGEAEILGQVR